MSPRIYSASRVGWLLAACLLAAGCSNPGVSALKRAANATQEVADLLKSVQGPPSALAATPNIEPTYKEMIDSLKELADYAAEHGDMIRGRKTTIEGLTKDIQRLQAEIKAETDRLQHLPGLPAEFWNVLRLHSYRVAGASLEMMQMASPGAVDPSVVQTMKDLVAVYEKFGAEKVVEIKLRYFAGQEPDEALAKLREVIGQGAVIQNIQDPENSNGRLIVAAPAPDFDAFIAKIDFGKVTEQDAARRELTIQLEYPHQARREEMQRSQREQAERIQADLERQRPDVAENMERSAAAQAERERMRAEAMARHDEAINQFREPDPDAPDYLDRLVELVEDEHAPHHHLAVERLLGMRPADVGDKAVRGKIARAFRELALSSRMHRREAVEGLVVWGGKYSVPIFVEMLEQERMGDNGPVFEALAKVPTEDGAEAAARYLGEFFNKDEAASSLRRMGRVAEPALIDAAPSDDPDVSLAAVQLLGDVGTQKSFPMLRKAARSENEEVAAAALQSIQKIQRRMKRSR